MKAICSTEKLKKGVSLAERITGKNLTLPVLSSLLIIAKEKGILIRSTNLNLGIEINIPSKVEKEGVCAVSGAVLNGILSNFNNDENITLELVGNSLKIITGNNKINIKTNSYEDFPTIPVVEGVDIIIPAQKFIDGIRSVYYSATISDIKPEISTVYVYPDEESLYFVSTDSFRLAEKKIKIKNLPEFSGILIPYKNVIEILRVFGDYNEELKITISKNQASFVVDNIYLTTRLIDGIFPDYKQIIPKETKSQAIILKSDLLNTLKISTIISDKFNQITFSINTKEKKCEIISKNADIGDQTTQMSGALNGIDTSLNLNFKYLLDSFQSLTGDSVAIKVFEPSKPVIIESVGDTSFTYLIMPMNR